ncbi:FadD3 family acyl-CoA ligase [Rhodococcus sp. H29-C3]|uniref:FadD3 family acyl-CoA ligase n=1 Tax=Rhodococcus sp. H29-C3 TaxID=3046307 RepID=UPI0024BADB60|nr:FadD3 family acyl-CoA ligase [Rhodococcus sp. H29-C3]MDJ0360340.1 FadD3 family acyl-CoA ligase [Rhodococcus sp. H29-C3]
MIEGPSTTPAALTRAAENHPDRLAIIDGDCSLTFAQLHEQVEAFASSLIASGVEAGARVAIWSPNTYHWIVAALGTHWAGGVVVPINTRYTGTEAADIIDRVHAAALVVVGDFLGTDRLDRLQEAAPELQVPLVVRIPLSGTDQPKPGVTDWDEFFDVGTATSHTEADIRSAAVDAESVSDILFTSGTTGRSKGVLSAHRQLMSVAQSWTENAALTAEDNYLIINPFFHSFGYKAGFVTALLAGATVVPMAVFDVEAVMAIVSEQRISVLPGAPTIYQSILDHPRRADYDMSNLRIAVTGAAPVPVALVERMQTELSFDAVLTAYGQTEAVVATMCRIEDDPVTVSTSSGRATAGFEIRIGEHDEILLRGPNVMLGYLDDPEATAKTIDPDGWLHTGDVGVLDDRGYLDITDRLKDMYISGGFNVYPAEIEAMLLRLPGVYEAAVIGVPDERMGEVGRAYVVLAPGTDLSEEAIVSFCKDKLAGFKAPRSVQFTEVLPRNASGKVLKNELREKKS